MENKWSESSYAYAQARREKRRNLTDFERFKVMKLKKQVSQRPGEVESTFAASFWLREMIDLPILSSVRRC